MVEVTHPQSYADVEKMIDESLCTGRFNNIDELYVQVLNGSCRHVGHSGPNGFPSKKDRCAVLRKVKDKKETAENKEKWEKQKEPKSKKPKIAYKEVYT